MKRLRFIDTQGAFVHWEAGPESVLQERWVLAKRKRCCACGKLIEPGSTVLKALVSWGRRDSQREFRPLHVEQCIAEYMFTYYMEDESVVPWSTRELNRYYLERIVEPDARTDDEAIEWAAYAASVLEDITQWVNWNANWKTYTIHKNGELLQSKSQVPGKSQ